MKTGNAAEWKVDWPSVFIGALSGALITWVATTTWIASGLVK